MIIRTTLNRNGIKEKRAAKRINVPPHKDKAHTPFLANYHCFSDWSFNLPFCYAFHSIPHTMGDNILTSPLLSSPTSDHPHLIVTVHDDSDSTTHPGFRNPFAFLGSSGFTVPVSTTADPFRNQTLTIGGLYEWLKIVICLPIALARLLLFGVSLLIGFVATKLALWGWKDRQNPMPKWRCRIMWITRVCTRCILFAFGWVWSGFRLGFLVLPEFGCWKFEQEYDFWVLEI